MVPRPGQKRTYMRGHVTEGMGIFRNEHCVRPTEKHGAVAAHFRQIMPALDIEERMLLTLQYVPKSIG